MGLCYQLSMGQKYKALCGVCTVSVNAVLWEEAATHGVMSCCSNGVKTHCFKCIAQNERENYSGVEKYQANMLLQCSCFSQKMEIPSPTGSLLPSPLGQGPAWDYSPTCQAVWRLLHTMGQV